MNEELTPQKERFLQEVERKLLHRELDAKLLEDGMIHVKWNEKPLCSVDRDGIVRFRPTDITGPEVDRQLRTVIQAAGQVKEYMRIFERAPALKAVGLQDTFKVLADFGDAVLAGRSCKTGAKFVTWEWDFDRQSVHAGHYRFDKVCERAKLKQSVSRLVTILFPELEKLVPTLHMASVYALLSEFPGAKQVAGAHLTHLKAVLYDASRGRYGRDMATTLREAARCSVGSVMPAKSLELQHTIRLIRELDAEIEDIETAIQSMMDEIQSPITTIPGIGVRMGAMILAEIGDFSRFDSPDKILAYAGMSPSTYQSGQLSLSGTYSHMEKRGSRYLRYALYNATKYVCLWNPTFAAYLAKKRAEGKHYNVALSHAAKKLVRLIYAIEKSQKPYCSAA